MAAKKITANDVMKFDFQELDFEQLAEINEKTSQLIKERKKQAESAFVSEVIEKAKSLGLTDLDFSSLTKTKKPRKKSGPVPPKYRDPDNPENTWTSRGRTPKWLEAKLNEGAKLEDFLIEKE